MYSAAIALTFVVGILVLILWVTIHWLNLWSDYDEFDEILDSTGMTLDDAIELARSAALQHEGDHDYLPTQDTVEQWVPHTWSN